ncbi:MAG: CHAP domain-containing protein [Rhizomicrobium sp.]
MRGFLAICAGVGLAFGLAGCAGTSDTFGGNEGSGLTLPETAGTRIEIPPTPLECVPYARVRSGVRLFGDAGTWWARAEGRYRRSRTPVTGSVLVLTGYAGPGRGHLAVVTRLVSAREIRLDHANWLGDGAIYLDDPAVDVSPENDWSEVRIWNARAHAWGVRTYLVEGFVGPETVSHPAVVAAK